MGDTKINSRCYWDCELSKTHKQTTVHLSINKKSSFYYCKECKVCSLWLINPFKDQKPTYVLFGGDGILRSAKKMSRNIEKEKPSTVSKKNSRQSQSSTSELVPKRQKLLQLWHICHESPLDDGFNQKITSLANIHTFSFQ